MSNVQQTNASQVVVPAVVALAPTVEAPRVSMSVDDVEAFAEEVVTAFASYESAVTKASVTRMERVLSACGYLPKGLSAADYDRLTAKTFKNELATAVKRGKIAESTAAKIGSQLKAVALAVANGWKPDEGQGFASAYASAVAELSKASYAHVYGTAPKQGAPAGTKSSKKRPAPTPATPATPQASVTSSGALAPLVPTSENTSPEFKGDPKLAAALILTGQNKARAEKLVVVMGSFVEEFDKWTATILNDAK